MSLLATSVPNSDGGDFHSCWPPAPKNLLRRHAVSLRPTLRPEHRQGLLRCCGLSMSAQMVAREPLHSSRADGELASTSTNGPEAIHSSVGNVQSFLESVTPLVHFRTVQSEELKLGVPLERADVPFFWLRDFWAAFEQWSCYGAGVPLQLDTGEHVVQYYTPYLSGIQLFTRQDLDGAERRGQGTDSLRNDIDWSDTDSRDLRDSSSDGSDASDRLRPRLLECTSSVSSGIHSAALGKKGSVEGAISPSSSQSDDTGSPSTGTAAGTSQEAATSSDLPWSACVDCKGGDLCFQYFEKQRPHTRLPFCDQIWELEKQYPAITSLRSMDLHPSSWISVAWYPLYMIPSSLSLKELGACFLTFHGLSTQLPSLADSCSRCRDEFWAAPRVFPDPSPKPTWESRLAASANILGLGSITAPSNSDEEAGRLEPVSKTLLPPFGMCGYKVKGDAWNDIRKFDRLRESADAWEQQMGANHFDFNFFSQAS